MEILKTPTKTLSSEMFKNMTSISLLYYPSVFSRVVVGVLYRDFVCYFVSFLSQVAVTAVTEAGSGGFMGAVVASNPPSLAFRARPDGL